MADKKKPVSVYLDDKLKSFAVSLAAGQKRSLNNLIEVLLQDAVDRSAANERLQAEEGKVK